MRYAARAALASTGLALVTGCLGPVNQDTDYYSQIIGVCGYQSRDTLTAECKTALEAIIPFDESWSNAPAGMKDSITQAFQVMAAYPLKMPPEYRILGLDARIPPDHRCIFAPEAEPELCFVEDSGREPNLQKNIFNYVLNKVDNIVWEGHNDDFIAYYNLSPTKGRKISIYDSFGGSGFENASTLIHEARHGDGDPHDLCDGQATCDTEMGGSYGIEVTYLTLLVHGSLPLLSDGDLSFFSTDQCYSSQHRFRNQPPSLKTLFDGVNCWSLDENFILEREGLASVRAALPLSGSPTGSRSASKSSDSAVRKNCGTLKGDGGTR